MERTESFQILRVELFASAAVQTGAIRIAADGERATQTFMPAAEKRAEQTDFIAERLAGSVDERFRRSILF
jgi:hypothetical protein